MFFVHKPNGQVLEWGTRLGMLNTAGNMVTEIDITANLVPDAFRIVNGQIVESPRPAGPSDLRYDPTTGNWVEPFSAADRLAKRTADVRAERDAKLRATDWTQLPDAPVDTSAWAAYRQSLRDLPAQANFPDISWPVDPDGNM